ncbi:hypothetical protein H103_03125 [Trichophyton rubrum CBS 288.86]|uniref:Tachykinin family protein n=3 Tax=Trichophyton rubrum TaxID=5551 RepID=A0A178EVR1_TRIRU|nr:uncharacterized protein TERG_05728 [Trichophyton rubrum CBS 118892]EZF24234.1 hypothetical protein H100_03118 [Trichophyton rubrum MR850]EZF43397.1 hypothetical protein H102_03111 [Trichophyton rubrum CBS 100081]EZF54039.1 hypothetical protein H103_03125 [Trichophyton rubrum CBS 288.86]EZF85945.1 hypothetical protein H110_03119 [Trichophyton rubrum MR1448]EZG18234.1 hypothetical protein H107_03218 [Trichophyton rubrum CBS 202.88]KMQ46775.1 hypothetical protein HL42_2523 [Trichophyton rubru
MAPPKSPIIVPTGFAASPNSSSSSSSGGGTPPAARPRPSPEQSLAHERPSFTFIGQDDEAALKGRKGSDTRKMIRSHVMRDVRRRERIAGLKRVSKKTSKKNEAGASPSPSSTSSLSSLSSLSSTTTATTIAVQSQTDDQEESATDAVAGGRPPPSWVLFTNKDKTKVLYIFNNPLTTAVYQTLDPMDTLKGFEGIGHVVSNLVYYINHCLIPMTFPIEARKETETKKRLAIMRVSALSSSASFFAQMTLSAAHKAIFEQHHSISLAGSDKEEAMLLDPTYYVMKAKCIAEMNRKLQDPDPMKAVDDTAIDIVTGLISATLTLGLFEEARVHWQGMKKIVDFRGGIVRMATQGSRGIGAVLTCDLKAAYTLLSRPIFPLAWEPQALPPEVREKIEPPPNSQLRHLTKTLCANKHLSSKLISLMQEIRHVFFFEIFNRTDASGLSNIEYEMFLMKAHEMEYELLDYPYREPEAEGVSDKDILKENPIESVARLTALSYFNSCFVVSPPEFGTGRAITKHLKDALAKCVVQPLSEQSHEDRSLLAWAAFISISGAWDQTLRKWLVEVLHNIIVLQYWRSWEEVESVMHGYLYAGQLHGHIWRKVWFEAQSFSSICEIDG